MQAVFKSPSLERAVDQRTGNRYKLKSQAYFLQEGKSVGVGEILDISKSGAALRANSPINVLDQYELFIQRVGRVTATIIRKFDVNCYGVRFDVSESTKCRLEKSLKDLAASDSSIIELVIDNT